MSVEKPRVLIITYYWPPAGGPGVQRWLKMTKYLPENGWDPVVLTPENPEYPAIDAELLREVDPNMHVEYVPVWEPYSLYQRILGGQSKKKSGKADKAAYFTSDKAPGIREILARWIRGNFFIPDARIFWVKPAVKRAIAMHRDQAFDAIITSGPPHSLHLIGQRLAKKLDLPWMADFRDPWTRIFYWDDLYIGWPAGAIHRRLERRVAQLSDALVVTSQAAGDHFRNLREGEVTWIQNGFDPSDFEKKTSDILMDEVASAVEQVPGFVVLHIGTMGPTQNVPGLWRALRTACDLDEKFKQALEIRTIGPVDHSIICDLKDQGLEEHLTQLPYIEHRDVPAALRKAHLLTAVIPDRRYNKGIIPGKVYEYLAAERPILVVGPHNGDVQHLLHSLLLQGTFEYDADPEMLAYLQQVFSDVQNKLPFSAPNIDHLSRRHLAGDVAKVLNRIRDKKGQATTAF